MLTLRSIQTIQTEISIFIQFYKIHFVERIKKRLIALFNPWRNNLHAMTEFSTFIVSSKLNTIFFLVANYILGSLIKVSEGRKADVEENTQNHRDDPRLDPHKE